MRAASLRAPTERAAIAGLALALSASCACDRGASRSDRDSGAEKGRVEEVQAHLGSGSDAMVPQTSPDGRWTLTPSLHEGTLLRVTVRQAADGVAVDEVDVRNSDAMKWVAGWVDETSYVFWGADMGTRWVRAFDGSSWSERSMTDSDCATLERLFEMRYREHHGDCLRPE